MEPVALGLFVVCFGGLYIAVWAFWHFVERLLSKASGMVKNLEADTGTLLRESSWGPGNVNGIGGCLRVAEYEKGLVVRRLNFFAGGGILWLPKDTLRIGEVIRGGFFSRKYCIVRCGKNHLRFLGKLADFVRESLPVDLEDGTGEGLATHV
jgi:hypothetical protein